MIISQSMHFIFVHIPKTAGTSVSRAIEPFLAWNDICIGAEESWKDRALGQHYGGRFGIHKHATANELRTAIGDDVWGRTFSFAIVRDPIERAASMWRYLRTWRNWKGSGIMDTFDGPNDYVKSDFFKTDGPARMHKEQAFWLDMPIDFIGRQSCLSDDMGAICKHIGLPPLKLEHANRSQPADVQFDTDALATLHNRYAEDMRIFKNPRQLLPNYENLPSNAASSILHTIRAN